MKAKLFFVTGISMLLFMSCNRDGKFQDVSNKEVLLELKQEKIEPLSPSQEGNEEEPQLSGNRQSSTLSDSSPVRKTVKPPLSNPDWDKKIVKTANLAVEVKNFKQYGDKVRQAVKQFGGYVAQEEQHLSDEKSETVITIKVPVAQFEDMMNQLPSTDSKIIERKITSDDVTGEVVDTRSRLEAKKQMRLKYLDFLKQSKNMEEVLQVQSEINGIQEEIEAASGRIGYLTNQAAYSTIHLTFYQPMDGYKPSDVQPGFSGRIAAAFKTGASLLGDLFIGLIYLWPLVLILFGAIFLWRKLKPMQKKIA